MHPKGVGLQRGTCKNACDPPTQALPKSERIAWKLWHYGTRTTSSLTTEANTSHICMGTFPTMAAPHAVGHS
eukprot:8821410-Lingulodinium_polyedra.AAC.1